MSGYVGNLSPEQEEALRKLRAAVADIPDKPEDDDYFYLRWLRARKFKVRKAEEMLRNLQRSQRRLKLIGALLWRWRSVRTAKQHLENRKKFNIDTILTDWRPPEVLRQHMPGGSFGEDRDGHPVWYEHIDLDYRGLLRAATREDIIKFKCMHGEQMVHKCKEFSAKKGRHIETFTVVYNLEALGIQELLFWQGIELVREILAQFEANFPERVKSVFVVKAPSIFPMAYNLVKSFIDPKTRQKIYVLGGANWQEELYRYISPDQLPQACGGTTCEPDPWCTNYITHNTSDVPPEYFLTNLTETSRQEMERVVVGRGGAHKIRCEVAEAQSLLKWEFISIDYDIAFQVYYKGNGKQKEEVVAQERKKSHLLPASGFHRCEKPGTYVLKFDNSYSWTRQKEIFYSVKILPPGTELPLPAIPEVDPTHSSDSEDEFFDCTEDPPDQPVMQTGLTSSARMMAVDSEGATGTSVSILRTSISTTV